MTFNFILHSYTNSNRENPIYLKIIHDYKRVKVKTKITIPKQYWNLKTKVVKNSKAFPQAFEINTQLADIKQKSLNVYNRYKSEYEKEPELKELKKLIENRLFGSKDIINWNLLNYYNHYLTTIDAKLNNKGRPFTSAYKNSMKNTLVKLTDFKKEKNISVDFKNIDMNFYNELISYLNTLDYKANYIGKIIKNFCTVLNEATNSGLNNNLNYKRFKIIEETSTEIYLNEDELKEMKDLELETGSDLDHARDLFLFSAYTGLRYSDIKEFNNKADIKADVFSFKVQKTQTPISIPILPVTKEILNKYSNILPSLSNPKFNKLLKEIGKSIHSLNKTIKIEYTRGGTLRTEEIVKHKLLKAHSGRRSFATNMVYRRMSINLIMSITGHKKESNFYKYVKLSAGYKADQFLDEFNKIV